MLKILCAGCLSLSQAISSQFSFEIKYFLFLPLASELLKNSIMYLPPTMDFGFFIVFSFYYCMF